MENKHFVFYYVGANSYLWIVISRWEKEKQNKWKKSHQLKHKLASYLVEWMNERKKSARVEYWLLAVNSSTNLLRLANVFSTRQEVCHASKHTRPWYKCADKNESNGEFVCVRLCIENGLQMLIRRAHICERACVSVCGACCANASERHWFIYRQELVNGFCFSFTRQATALFVNDFLRFCMVHWEWTRRARLWSLSSSILNAHTPRHTLILSGAKRLILASHFMSRY